MVRALCPPPWAVPTPSHTAFPAGRAPGISGQPPLPPDFLRDSSAPEENQYFSTHQRKGREKHSMGKGTRRMLLACLIPAVRPRVPLLGWLWEMALVSLPTLQSRASTARGGGQSSAATSDHGASTPQSPQIFPGIHWRGWRDHPFPHPTAHPAQNPHPSARLGLVGNKSCSSPLPNSGRLRELPKPSVMPELLI